MFLVNEMGYLFFFRILSTLAISLLYKSVLEECVSALCSNVITIPFLRSSDGRSHIVNIDQSWSVFYIPLLQYTLQLLKREHQEMVFYHLSLIQL
jgi:hypothetical protein